jgi:hypothetical protein
MKILKIESLIISVSIGFIFLVAGACSPAYAQEEKHDQDARPEKQEQRQEPQQDRGQQEHQQQDKGQQEHQQQAKDQQHQQQAKVQQEHQQQGKEQQDHQPQVTGRQEQHQQQTKNQQQVTNPQKQQPQQTKTLEKKKRQQPMSASQQKPQQQAKPIGKSQVKPVSQTQQQARVGLQKQQVNQPSQPVQHVAQAEQKTIWQQHRAQNWQADHRTWQERGGYSGYRIPEDHYHGHFGQYHSFHIYSHSMEIYDGYPRFQYNGYWFGVLDPWPESWSDDWYERDYVYIVYSNDGYYMYNRNHPGFGIAVSVYMN